MKNSNGVESAVRKTALTPPDIGKIVPNSDDHWQTNGTIGHHKDMSQGSASSQYVTQNDAVTEKQKLLAQEGIGPTPRKENTSDQISKIELLRVENEQKQSKLNEFENRPKELQMNRPLTSEELKEKFKLQWNLPIPVKHNSMIWINHIGNKCVTVEIQTEDKKVENQSEDQNDGLFDGITFMIYHYIFRLYNSEFIEIGCFKYTNDLINYDIFSQGDCTFSPDSHYFGFIFNEDSLGIAYFPHGFEHDMFVEQQYGQAALDQMFKDSNQYVKFYRELALDVPLTEKELSQHFQYENETKKFEKEDDLDKSMNEIAEDLPFLGNPEACYTKKIQVRISKTNFIYLFRNVDVTDKNFVQSKMINVYKSNMTVQNFLSALKQIPLNKMESQYRQFKHINMVDYFSKLQTLENKLERIYLRGPLVIGITKSEIQQKDDEEEEEEDEDDEDEEDEDDEDEEDEEQEAYKIEFLFDYEEDKIVVFDFNKKLDPQEMKKLKSHFIYQPSLGQGYVKWYFVSFAINKKIHIFKRCYNLQTKEISLLYRYSYTMPQVKEEDEDDGDLYEPLKIIGMKTFIFGDKQSSLQYFDIEEGIDEVEEIWKNNFVFKREIICPEYACFGDYKDQYIVQMHQSSILRLTHNQICNYQKQPFDIFSSRIIIPESINLDKNFDQEYSFDNNVCAQIIGTNCFEEVLSEWDFRIQIGKSYKRLIKNELYDNAQRLIFYSKRLNIALFIDFKQDNEKEINHTLIIIDLRGKIRPIRITKQMRFPIIRSIKEDNSEILKVYVIQETQKFISCYTIKNSIDTVIEANIQVGQLRSENKKVIVSQNGQQVTIFDQQTLTVLLLENYNHSEFIMKKIFSDIPFPSLDQLYHWENRIMINDLSMFRVSEDYQKIEVATEFKNDNLYTIEGEKEQFKFIYGFQIGDQLLGLFCFEYQGSTYGTIYVYEIASMSLKAFIERIYIDIKFSSQSQIKLQSFSSEQQDFGVLFFKPKEDKKQVQQYILKLRLYDKEVESLCGVPLKMVIRPNVVSKLEMDTGNLAYYPMNLENKIQEFSMLTSIKLRYYFDPQLDFLDVNPTNSLIQNENEVIQSIQKASIQDLTSYNVINRSFYICNLQRNPMFKKFINQVIKRLEYIQDNIPFLLCEDIDGINPLQEALKNFNGNLAQSILQLCISGDNEFGFMYSSAINNLKPYLCSNLPYHQVEEQYNFGTYETDPNNRMICSNKQTLIEALLDKGSVVIEKQDDLKSTISNLLKSKEEQTQRYRIAYNIVNMKELIGRIESQDSRECIKIISDLSKNDVSYYDIEVLQAIIKFKWETYTRKFFLWQFIFLIIFFAVYVADLIFGSKTFGLSKEIQWIGFVATRTICQFILIYFLQFEVKQLIRNGFLDYFSSIWNINDMLLQFVYTSYLILSFVAPTELYAIKSLQSCVIYVTFVKIGFYMRTFSELSFLVQMLLNVFYDLRFFLFFFGVVIVSFSLYLGILVNELTDYEGIGIFGYFGIALRTSLGDYDFDSFVKNSDYDILTWIVWLLMMIVGNVIFMNFIIAVVSQSYENCMQSMKAQSFKNKVDLIMERESLMDEADLSKSEWFPNFIIVRKALLDGADASQLEETQGEWQGMLKEMQKGVKKQVDQIRDEMKKSNIKIENQIDKAMMDVGKAMTEIKQMIQKKEKEEKNKKKKNK